MEILYAVLLLFAFYLMLVGEFLLPTGGLMGFGAAAALISMLVISFSHSSTTGVVMLAVVFVSTPLLMSALIRIYPKHVDPSHSAKRCAGVPPASANHRGINR
jgi:membrane protein implicated in regulation of membrane protease activity